MKNPTQIPLFKKEDFTAEMIRPPCNVPGCERPHYGKGWCRSHYHAQWQGQVDENGVPFLQRDLRKPRCSVDGCVDKVVARGLCRQHYDHERRASEARIARAEKQIKALMLAQRPRTRTTPTYQYKGKHYIDMGKIDKAWMDERADRMLANIRQTLDEGLENEI